MGIQEEQINSLRSGRVPQAADTEAMQVRRLTPLECSRLQGFPDTWFDVQWCHGEKSEAHAREVLRRLWRTAPAEARERRRPGIALAFLTPEVLLAGVHVGWLSWSMAVECAQASRALSGEDTWPEGFMHRLSETASIGPSPYRQQSFEQLASELGRPVSELPFTEAQAAEVLRHSSVWAEASAQWPLQHARSTSKAGDPATPDSPRYRALGNAVTVSVAQWVGERILSAHQEIEA